MRTPEEILEQEFRFGIPLNGFATETIVPAMIKYAEQFSNQVEPPVKPESGEEKIIADVENKIREVNKAIKWKPNEFTGEIDMITFTQILEDLPEILRAKYLDQE